MIYNLLLKKISYYKKILKDIEKVEGAIILECRIWVSLLRLFKDQISAKKAINKLKFKYPKFWISFAKLFNFNDI